jgi:hypothetical protein
MPADMGGSAQGPATPRSAKWFSRPEPDVTAEPVPADPVAARNMARDAAFRAAHPELVRMGRAGARNRYGSEHGQDYSGDSGEQDDQAARAAHCRAEAADACGKQAAQMH